MKISAVICAAGKGSRMGMGINKVYLELCSHPVLFYSIKEISNSCVDEIIIVTGQEDIEMCKRIVDENSFAKVKKIVCGGDCRQKSVYNGILECSGDIILIHDGARALIKMSEIENVIHDCIKYGASALGTKPKDTLKNIDKDGYISSTLNRENVCAIATPQVFFREDIIYAHKVAMNQNKFYTDDCALIEEIGKRIKVTQGSYENIKLTTKEDIIFAENIINNRLNKI